MSSTSPVAGDDDDYTHVIGTSVNLDYKPDGGGPYPRDELECWFSLAWQITSESYAYKGRSPSVCLNVMTAAERAAFLGRLDGVLRRVRSIFPQPGSHMNSDTLKIHNGINHGSGGNDNDNDDNDNDDNKRACDGPMAAWTFVHAVHRKKNAPSKTVAPQQAVAEDQAKAIDDQTGDGSAGNGAVVSHDTVFNQTRGENGRDRIFLVYASRMDSDHCRYCDDFAAVPFSDKALLLQGMIRHFQESCLNFRQFIHDDSLAGCHLFKRYIADHAQLLGIAEDTHAAITAEQQYFTGNQAKEDAAHTGNSGTLASADAVHPHLLTAGALRIGYGDGVVLRYARQLELCRVRISCDQRLVLYLAVDRTKNLFISGPAGSGKSYISRLLIQELATRDVRHAVTAMTGKASIIVGGSTFHRWAGIGLGKGKYEQLKASVLKYGTNLETNRSLSNWTTTDTLFVDESSMFGTPMFIKSDKLGRELRGRDGMLFGGIQLVMVGDYCQLPPVYKRDEEKPKWRYCFQTPNWRDGVEWEIELEKIYRQNDPEFVGMLNNMRKGNVTPAQRAFLQSRLLDNLSTETKASELFRTATRIYPKKEKVAQINNREMAALSGEQRTFTWDLHYNEAIPQSMAAREETLAYFEKNLAVDRVQNLKIGARVLCTATVDAEGKIVNGTAGTVVGWSDPQVPAQVDRYQPHHKRPATTTAHDGKSWPMVQFDETGTVREMRPHKFYREQTASARKRKTSAVGKKRKGAPSSAAAASHGDSDDDDDDDDGGAGEQKWLAYVEQVPLQLGWAVTVHRSQGCTLRSAIVGARDMFERGQMYVAVSRVKTPDGLFLDGLRMEDLRVDSVVIKYYDRVQADKTRLFGSFSRGDDTGKDDKFTELRGDREFRLMFADLFRAYRTSG